MPFSAQVLYVLIASPGDVAEARNVVEETIRVWNADHAHTSGVVLLPLRWELNAVSDLRSDPQSVINDQLVDHADIVVGLFHQRLGTPTPRALSGTVEELDRSVARGVDIHVYFSKADLPYDVDLAQAQAVRDFRKELQQRGLIGTYLTLPELGTLVRSALEKDVATFLGRRPTSGPNAIMNIAHEVDANGRVLIELRNGGTGTAEEVRLRLTSDAGSVPINQLDQVDLPLLAPQDHRSFPVYLTHGAADQWRINVSWAENGRTFEASHEVRM